MGTSDVSHGPVKSGGRCITQCFRFRLGRRILSHIRHLPFAASSTCSRVVRALSTRLLLGLRTRVDGLRRSSTRWGCYVWVGWRRQVGRAARRWVARSSVAAAGAAHGENRSGEPSLAREVSAERPPSWALAFSGEARCAWRQGASLQLRLGRSHVCGW